MEYLDQTPSDLNLCVTEGDFSPNQFTILKSCSLSLPQFSLEGHIIGESHCMKIRIGDRVFGEIFSCAPKFEGGSYHHFEINDMIKSGFNNDLKELSIGSDLDYYIETELVAGKLAAERQEDILRDMLRCYPIYIEYVFPSSPNFKYNPTTALGINVSNLKSGRIELSWRSLHTYPNTNSIVSTESEITIG